MDLEAVDPAIRPALLTLPNADPDSAAMRRVARLLIPLMPSHRTPGVTITTHREGGARVRVHVPEGRTGAGGALLWIHGGGFVIGAAKIDDRLCGETAAALGIVVVSAEYRLAPAHPFPAGLDDVHAAWAWLLRHGDELGVDSTRLAIGGQSAGGGLAATLVQRVHDEGGVQPVAQWLLSPMLDDRTAARTQLDAVEHRVWSNAANRVGWSAYLGHAPGAATEPPYAVGARRAALAGLPPAWLDCGTIELFHDEVVEYAGRLRAAGVDSTLVEVPGAPHGFETWAADSAPARAVTEMAHDWLRSRLED